MAVLERVGRLLEERLGVSLMSGEDAQELRENAVALRELRDEAEDLAYRTLSYGHGKPQELRPESRVRLAQRGRVAWMEDPLAGTESEHYANFSLGRGVGRPKAADAAVQQVIDEAWKDSVNIDTLVGYEAMRALSNELRAGSNIFLLGFPENGKVRVSFLESDTVQHIISEDGNRFRPLWYVSRKPTGGEWDFTNHRPKPVDVNAALKPVYYAHWRNVDQIRQERKRNGQKAIDEPGREDVGEGLVYHVRINRLLEQQFGVPLGRRTLRFQAALNKMVEARVNMQLAASSFIAKRVVHGTGGDVSRAAEALLQQTGVIGTGVSSAARRGLTGLQPPPRAGSVNVENESDRLEPLSLNSGSAGAQVDAMLVRGAAISPSAMGQHYYGASDATNLASAATMELPALMSIEAYQQTLEQILRWFTDYAIQEAVRTGKLGGSTTKQAGDKPLQELVLQEADDRAQAERRTGKDLGYTLQMPYPGRRNLPDVVGAVTGILTQLSPIGENPDLTKIALEFLFTHGFQLEDPAAAAKEVVDTQTKLLENQQQAQAAQAESQAKMAQMGALAAAQPGGNGRPPSGPTPPGRADTSVSQYGEKRQTAQPGGDGTMQQALTEQPLPPELERLADLLAGHAEEVLRVGVQEPALAAAAALNGH